MPRRGGRVGPVGEPQGFRRPSRADAGLAAACSGLLLFLFLAGCAGSLETAQAGFAYRQAKLPAEQAHLDLAYRSDADADPDKHRLDLYLPAAAANPAAEPNAASDPYPTLIFIHGGGWTHGDRAMGALGIEPMRNVGRFYAARGIASAVISYRLQPGVTWDEQIRDAADAIAWIEEHIVDYGGAPDRLFVSGHSAGAWLAAWNGLAEGPLARAGADRSRLCGLILVSGAGYDLVDEQTYALGARRSYFEERFGGDRPGWAEAASVVGHIGSPVPPTLVLSAAGEPEKLERQSDLLFEALQSHRRGAQRIIVPGQNHQRIVIGLSRPGDPVSEAALTFLQDTPCPAAR